MIILCILLAFLGGVVVYASERENSIFFSTSVYDLQELSCL